MTHTTDIEQVDSVEDSHLNVTFGYLAVLLGYIALSRPLSKVMRAGLPGATYASLIAAIDEFICHHKQVDALTGGDDDEASTSSASSSLTARLTKLLGRVREVEHDLAQ